MRIAIFAFALSLILCTLADTAGARPKPKTHTVAIEGMMFQPEALTVAVGDIVVWVNKDLVPHTATSSKAGIFDSKLIEPDKSWELIACGDSRLCSQQASARDRDRNPAARPRRSSDRQH